MKISIWQQFSSNHSNNFTLVGEFATEEDAAHAAIKLREIFGQIAAQSKWDDAVDDDDPTPRPIEQQYAQEYGIRWDEHLDWVSAHTAKEVVTFDKLLILTPGAETWLGASVVGELIAKLGGRVQTEEEISDSGLHVTITAQAPDREIPVRLLERLKTYHDLMERWEQDPLGRSWNRPPSPWEFHAAHKPDDSYESVIEEDKRRRAINAKWDSLTAEIDQLRLAGASDADQRVQALEQERLDLVKPYTMPDDKAADWHADWHATVIYEMTPSIEAMLEQTTVNDDRLIMENLWFSSVLGYALPALVNWLRGEGCQVEYSIESREVNG